MMNTLGFRGGCERDRRLGGGGVDVSCCASFAPLLTLVVLSGLRSQANIVAALSPEDFARVLNSRNPVWLEIQAGNTAVTAADVGFDVEADADADQETEAETETEVEAGVDAEADADADAEVDVDSEDAPEDKSLLAAEAVVRCRVARGAGSCQTNAACPASFGSPFPSPTCRSGTYCCVPKTRAGGSSGGTGGSSGGTGGSSGGTGGSSGGTGGSSGGTGGSSGGTGGSSGGTGGSSGGTGGSSGGTGGSSGGTGGHAGRQTKGRPGAPIIVQPRIAVSSYLPVERPLTDWRSLEDRVCQVFYKMFLYRYGTRGMSAASIPGWNRNPSSFCERTLVGRPNEQLVIDTYKKVMRVKDHTYMNPIVSQHTSTIEQQLQCGSCWAQASIGSIEVAQAKKGSRAALSVQQILDCIRTSNSNGCNGGTPMDALRYARTHGMATAAAYPYTARQGTCRESLGSRGPRLTTGWVLPNLLTRRAMGNIKNFAVCTTPRCENQWTYELDLVLAVETQGPYIAYVDATQWQRYRTGIFPSAACSSTLEAGNHIVQLMGYGLDGPSGIPYWLGQWRGGSLDAMRCFRVLVPLTRSAVSHPAVHVVYSQEQLVSCCPSSRRWLNLTSSSVLMLLSALARSCHQGSAVGYAGVHPPADGQERVRYRPYSTDTRPCSARLQLREDSSAHLA
jgi:hypothetical protein